GLREALAGLRIVYTPLHGTGLLPVQNALSRLGAVQVRVVPEQAEPDGDFPTAPSPNPEAREAFALALSLAQAADADLIIGTDPDADRMGVMVRKRRDGSEGDPGDGDSYVLLNGNQIGALLLHYILTRKKRA